MFSGAIRTITRTAPEAEYVKKLLLNPNYMLKGISPVISPELLKVLSEMGHGDEIVFGDGNFPSGSHSKRLIRADGITITALLEAIMPFFPLDYTMEWSAVTSQYRVSEPEVWGRYRKILMTDPEGSKPFLVLPKAEFYKRASESYCVVATSESEGFANIILRKGVVRL